MPLCKDINIIIADYIAGDKAYWRSKFDLVVRRLTVRSPRLLFRRRRKPDVFTLKYLKKWDR